MGTWGVLFDRRFLPAFFTQFFGAFNDNFFKNALVILVTYQSASIFGLGPEIIVALSGAIFIVPFFLFSATAGQIADKLSKTKLMVSVKLCEVAIMGVAAYGFLSHQFAALLLALFLMGCHSAFFGPVKYSYLPQAFPKAGDLLAANALFQTGTFLAILLGTIGGGLIVAIKPLGELYVSLGAIGVAIIGLLFSLRVHPVPSPCPDLTIDWNPLAPTSKVIRDTMNDQNLFLSILGISWFWFFGAAMLSLFPIFCKSVLGADERVTTLFLALFSVGIGLGSMLAKKISGARIELGLVPFGSFGLSFFTLMLWASSPIRLPVPGADFLSLGSFVFQSWSWPICLALFGLSLSGGLFIVPLMTFIQEHGDPQKLSRIIASNNVLNAAAMVLAALLLMGFFAARISVPTIFFFLALMNLAVACFIYLRMPEFLLRFLALLLAHCIYRIHIRHGDRIPERGACILASNHVTYVDFLIIAACCRRPVRFVMDHTFQRLPLLGWLFRHGKVIVIAQAKENPLVLEQAFKAVAEELRAGHVVCIFPEGRLSRDGKLSPFRRGIQRALETTPVPVVPLALEGLWGSVFCKGKGLRDFFPGFRWRPSIEFRVGNVMQAHEVTPEKLQDQVGKLLLH